ncbi:unnamed protein product [Trichogramma brassicae]|uniref:Uncharacterized protein n=1 Tax=Trichogramma brassicae TaxID=86971 RepID=A0A6H5ITJ3_9HYME|nr:unnamed protein product [Trichogramma brassicae]
MVAKLEQSYVARRHCSSTSASGMTQSARDELQHVEPRVYSAALYTYTSTSLIYLPHHIQIHVSSTTTCGVDIGVREHDCI